MIARLSLIGVFLANTAVADQAAFDLAFDICTNHDPRLADKAAKFQDLGWHETKGSHLSSVLAPAAIGEGATWTDRPGGMIENAQRFTAFALDGLDDPNMVRIYQPRRALHPPLVVVLREFNPPDEAEHLGSLRSLCIIATTFGAAVPDLLAGFDPDVTPYAPQRYFEQLHAPLQNADSAPAISIQEIKAAFVAEPVEAGILTIGPTALIEVTSLLMSNEDLEIYGSNLTPDPRYAE